jgi:poly-gamma-glutamate capsule biosynthesis protein CapA/YwtB (metallophosphatase superfamily)
MDLTIAFCGDIMLGAEVGERIGNATIGDWLSEVSEAWSDADLLIGNLESPCVVKAKPIEGPLPEIVFHAPADRLAELAVAGFSALTMANNHVLNCGPLGLMETIEGLDRAGIHHAGAGMNLAEAIRPAFIPVRGVTVGLVAFCYGPQPAGRSNPGVALHDLKTMRKALRSARAGADLVIAALHGGLEYSDVPPSETRARFRFLAENGADIVVGHHPHVLQGLEWIGNVPVAYSLGDFLFDNSLSHVAERNFARMDMGLYAPDEIQRDRNKFSRGALLTVNVSGNRKSVHWHPFLQGPDLRPRLCTGESKIEMLGRLGELSAALMNKDDLRHTLAESIMQTAHRAALHSLEIQEVIKLALRPRWRYVPRGLSWVLERIKIRVKNLKLNNSTTA